LEVIKGAGLVLRPTTVDAFLPSKSKKNIPKVLVFTILNNKRPPIFWTKFRKNPTVVVHYNTHHNSLHSLNSNLVFLISASLTVVWKGYKNIILPKNLIYKMSDIDQTMSNGNFKLYEA
jgi:hypothetical protein